MTEKVATFAGHVEEITELLLQKVKPDAIPKVLSKPVEGLDNQSMIEILWSRGVGGRDFLISKIEESFDWSSGS